MLGRVNGAANRLHAAPVRRNGPPGFPGSKGGGDNQSLLPWPLPATTLQVKGAGPALRVGYSSPTSSHGKKGAEGSRCDLVEQDCLNLLIRLLVPLFPGSPPLGLVGESGALAGFRRSRPANGLSRPSKSRGRQGGAYVLQRNPGLQACLMGNPAPWVLSQR